MPSIRPFWPPLTAGIALGLVLLLDPDPGAGAAKTRGTSARHRRILEALAAGCALTAAFAATFVEGGVVALIVVIVASAFGSLGFAPKSVP